MGLLDKISRSERLRDIVERVKRGETFSAFALAVEFNVAPNVIYRDVSDLKKEGHLPEDFEFARKER